MRNFRHIAIIVAAGKGLRMGTATKKQFLELDGVPVLIRTLETFVTHPGVDKTVLVVPSAELNFCRKLLAVHGYDRDVHLTQGGAVRQDSVQNGLDLAKTFCSRPEDALVLVHDGVRPFVTHTVIENCIAEAKRSGAAIPAVRISDTVKAVDNQGQVVETLDRNRLFRVQTPQVFFMDMGLTAFSHADRSGFSGTDEAAVLSHAGFNVKIVPGDWTNIKLTTPEDLVLGSFILARVKP